jgi:hypothetical protein
MGKSLQIILLLLVFAVFCGCGDNKKTDSTGKDTSQTQTEDKGTTSGDNQTSGENPENKSGANDLGMKEGLPADFPADVPQPPESKVIGSLSSTEGTNVSFESPKTTQEIADFYKAAMSKAGYTVSPDGEAVSETNAMIDWTKEGKAVSLVAVRDNSKNSCSVVITYK